MQNQLEKEVEEDQVLYDKLACWCSENSKEKKAVRGGAKYHNYVRVKMGLSRM
jgi:hypothetical protein